MENALQHALKNAMSNPQVAQMFDDEPNTKHSIPTLEKHIVQTQPDNTQAPERGAQVRAIYEMLVDTPKVTSSQLEARAKVMGHPWYDSISGQLTLLHERGLVVRVKMPPEGTETKSSYRYWPTAMTLADAVNKAKEERKAKSKPAFSINKEKAIKKPVQRLVPKQKPVPTVEQFEQEQAAQPIQLLRVGVDPKRVVESLSVRDARAVYEELKKLFS